MNYKQIRNKNKSQLNDYYENDYWSSSFMQCFISKFDSS